MTPGGLRLGASALTSRGFVEKDFVQVWNSFSASVCNYVNDISLSIIDGGIF